MIRVDSFARSVLFAAVAALGWLPWSIFCGGVVGTWNARALYLMVVAVVYIAGLGGHPSLRRLCGAGLMALAVSIPVQTTAELAIALAAIIGFCRSGMLHPATGARAIAVEVALLGGGLVFARYLALSWLSSTAVGIWGFFLVQSLFFLQGLPAIAGAVALRDGGFDEVYRRANDLLDQGA